MTIFTMISLVSGDSKRLGTNNESKGLGTNNESKGLGTNTCVFVDHVENNVSYEDIPCSNNSLCHRKEFHVTYINVVPYVYVWNDTYWGIDEILLKCCGSCVR